MSYRFLFSFLFIVASCAGDHVNGVHEGKYSVTSHCSFAEQKTGSTTIKLTTVFDRSNVSLGDVKPFGLPQNQVVIQGTGVIKASDESTTCRSALLGRKSKDLVFFCHRSGSDEESCLVVLTKS